MMTMGMSGKELVPFAIVSSNFKCDLIDLADECEDPYLGSGVGGGVFFPWGRLPTCCVGQLLNQKNKN